MVVLQPWIVALIAGSTTASIVAFVFLLKYTLELHHSPVRRIVFGIMLTTLFLIFTNLTAGVFLVVAEGGQFFFTAIILFHISLVFVATFIVYTLYAIRDFAQEHS